MGRTTRRVRVTRRVSVPCSRAVRPLRPARLRARIGSSRGWPHGSIAGPRASALVTTFAGQWLWLRNLSRVQPNATLFPEWEDTLRTSLQRETELFLESMIQADRPVPELLTADYTFVNARLAAHYGIPN